MISGHHPQKSDREYLNTIVKHILETSTQHTMNGDLQTSTLLMSLSQLIVEQYNQLEILTNQLNSRKIYSVDKKKIIESSVLDLIRIKNDLMSIVEI
jgi:hypothetical protein